MNKNTLIVAALSFVALTGIGVAVVRETSTSRQVAASIIALDATSLAQSAPAAPIDAAEAPVQEAISQPISPIRQVPQDMLGYSNKDFHFSLLFPANLESTEYKEQGGALTVSFQDPDTDEGFQVYVTPYSKKQIDAAQFKLDEPSGVVKEQQDVLADGARGTKFYGYNATLGDTREVWFIHNGFLYEVTTFKVLDEWLNSIMQTWKFI